MLQQTLKFFFLVIFHSKDRETAIGVLKVADNSHFLYSLLLLQKGGKRKKI